jgi:hypothetical protein
MAIYASSVLLACLLDEMWQIMAGFMCWIVVLALGFKFNTVSRISPLRGMSLISYPLTAPMPWTPIVASLMLACVCLYLSVLVLQRKEY